MDMKAAAVITLDLWQKRALELKQTNADIPEELTFKHCFQMYWQINNGGFSEAKLGRWLSWIQAACVANGCGTLEEMKEINKRYAG